MQEKELIDLVIAARDGDEEAFTELVDHYNRQVAQVVRAVFTCSADDLQDALQEVWIAAWRSLPNLRAPEKTGLPERPLAESLLAERWSSCPIPSARSSICARSLIHRGTTRT